MAVMIMVMVIIVIVMEDRLYVLVIEGNIRNIEGYKAMIGVM